MRQLKIAIVALLTCMTLGFMYLHPSSSSANFFSCPITCSGCIMDWYYYDHGSFFGAIDWNCGGSSYSDHVGSDYSLIGLNSRIDEGYDIVAAADGTVEHSEDGYFDKCTQCGGASCGYNFGNGFGNHVIINHGTYTTVYGHMRQGSVAVKEGETVSCGQVLGHIGSSGCSTGGHLHFEVRSGSTPIDPYQGNCSPTESSLWVEQGQYLALPGYTCDTAPPPPTQPRCPLDTYEIWTCNADRTARRRCIDGQDTIEECEWGCQVMPLGTDDICAAPPDGDGDGSRADVDCDDGNASVNPTAEEICGDGVDQDCSGSDEACITDADGDGSPSDVDCEDNDESVYPNAPEVCGDGIDQNCDGRDQECEAQAGTPGTQTPKEPTSFGQAGPEVSERTDEIMIETPMNAPDLPVAQTTYDQRTSEDGCGCRVSPSRRGYPPLFLALVLTFLLCTRCATPGRR